MDSNSYVGSPVRRPAVGGGRHEGEWTQGVPDVTFHYTHHFVKLFLHGRTTQHSTIRLQPNDQLFEAR